MTQIQYRNVNIDGLSIFYREAGDPTLPTLVLLHGFPTSSHMFAELITRLSDRFHLVAPDLPGFGQSTLLARDEFTYSFDNLAATIERFTEVVGLDRYAIYVFDYGAPVGFRLAVKRPECVTALISQNGNAYIEGLSEAWTPIERYWREPSKENREALRALLAPEAIRWQYEHGVQEAHHVSPDGSTLDAWYLARPGADEIQLDLMLDYASNVALYPTFQAYFRKHQPPTLAIWGANDPFFLPAGAQAYRRDMPNARVRLLDTGHFALATHVQEIADEIASFLGT